MHKAVCVCILASLLIPLGVWTSGCRRETARARIPDGPETAKLARAPETSGDETPPPPSIPALIDPEVLSVPDQPTFARIRAVMDREAALTSAQAKPGLFVLPRQDYPETAIVPANVPPIRPDIWSRPVTGDAFAAPSGLWSQEDLAAMAPPAVIATPAGPPEAYPSYSMPEMPAPHPLAAMPTPSAMAAPRPDAGDETLAALAPIMPLGEIPAMEEPDFFGNPDLGLLAPIGTLDNLSSLFLAGAPARTDSAPSPVALPEPRGKEAPTLPPQFLDISSLLADQSAPAGAKPAKAENEPAAMLPAPLSADMFDEPPMASRPAAASGDAGAFAEKTTGWETFKPPMRTDRQAVTLDPLIDYDFSSFARKEERQVRKIKLSPPEAGESVSGRSATSSVIEPDAPPLL